MVAVDDVVDLAHMHAVGIAQHVGHALGAQPVETGLDQGAGHAAPPLRGIYSTRGDSELFVEVAVTRLA